MKIKEMPVSELTEYKNNPRLNDGAVEYVASSIANFGFKVPMVIDKGGCIVCGHTRYKAALKLGLETVPCVIADDLTSEQIKAFRLADNKTAEFSSWDLPLMKEELEGILDIDMAQLGFDLTEDIPEAIDLTEENEAEPKEGRMCHCPKCGFAFEVPK